ncbi:MAG: PRC-barrel domain-containing protein [Nitrospirae bacterium]|nr:PRC-barrel domain-containing protein [Candidatus Manganitrophaceae bacterium]
MISGRALIGRPIYSLDRGEKIGEVKNLILDPSQRKVIGLVLKEGGLLRKPQIIPFENVENIGPDAIVLKRGRPIGTSEPFDPQFLKESFNLTGKKVMSEKGHDLGTVYDLEIDAQTGEVLGVDITQGLFQDTAEGKKYLDYGHIKQIGRHAVVISEEGLGAVSTQKGGLAATYQNIKEAGAESLERARGRSGLWGTTAREKKDSWGKSAQEQIEQLRIRSQSGFERGRRNASRFQGALSEELERIRLKTEAYFAWLHERRLHYRIKEAVGRRVARTILDPLDNVILQQGEMITYRAVQQAKESDMLDVLLDSVVKENFFALRRKETESASAEVFSKRPSPPTQKEDRLQRSA